MLTLKVVQKITFAWDDDVKHVILGKVTYAWDDHVENVILGKVTYACKC
jgi:hypothetical protein